jgi:hypothetical protein
MLDVGGRPFLDYLLDEASRYGIKRALLLCGYRAGDLTSIYNGRTIRGMRIEPGERALIHGGTSGAHELRRRHGELPQAQAAIVGRHALMAKNAEAGVAQPDELLLHRAA